MEEDYDHHCNRNQKQPQQIFDVIDDRGRLHYPKRENSVKAYEPVPGSSRDREIAFRSFTRRHHVGGSKGGKAE